MKGNTLAAGTALAAALALGGLALFQSLAARRAAGELAAARAAQAELQSRIDGVEKRLAQAEKLAREAERDTQDLLKAVAAVQPKPASSPLSRNPSEVVTAAPPNADQSPAEKERLAMERAYQQDLARRRQQEAMRAAELQQQAAGLDAAAAFRLRLDAARKLVEQAQFQAAQRLWNEAMTAKPADLPLPADAAQLKATLQAQSHPVEVSFVSDGQTFVSIAGARQLNQLQTATVKLMPGNYEVDGRRAGYRNVNVLLMVRADVPLAPVAVICTQPAK